MVFDISDNMLELEQNIYFSFDNYKMPMADLKVHMRRHNPEKLFKCNQCNYEGNQPAILDSGIKYNCDQCDFKAVAAGWLKRHRASQHEGIFTKYVRA